MCAAIRILRLEPFFFRRRPPRGFVEQINDPSGSTVTVSNSFVHSCWRSRRILCSRPAMPGHATNFANNSNFHSFMRSSVHKTPNLRISSQIESICSSTFHSIRLHRVPQNHEIQIIVRMIIDRSRFIDSAHQARTSARLSHGAGSTVPLRFIQVLQPFNFRSNA